MRAALLVACLLVPLAAARDEPAPPVRPLLDRLLADNGPGAKCEALKDSNATGQPELPGELPVVRGILSDPFSIADVAERLTGHAAAALDPDAGPDAGSLLTGLAPLFPLSGGDAPPPIAAAPLLLESVRGAQRLLERALLYYPGGFSLLLDLGGARDSYGRGARKDGACVVEGDFGVCWDLPFRLGKLDAVKSLRMP